MRGRKAEEIPLTEDDRRELERVSRAHTTPQQIAQRARIVLSVAQTRNQAETARIGRSQRKDGAPVIPRRLAGASWWII